MNDKAKELQEKIYKVEELYREDIDHFIDNNLNCHKNSLRIEESNYFEYNVRFKCFERVLRKLRADLYAINKSITMLEFSEMIDKVMANHEAKRGMDREKAESECLGKIIDKMDKDKPNEDKEKCRWVSKNFPGLLPIYSASCGYSHSYFNSDDKYDSTIPTVCPACNGKVVF